MNAESANALAQQIEEHMRELDHSGPTLALTEAVDLMRKHAKEHVSCLECGFTYDAAHSFADGHYECPLCARKAKCEGEWSAHICPDCYDDVRFNRGVVDEARKLQDELAQAVAERDRERGRAERLATVVAVALSNAERLLVRTCTYPRIEHEDLDAMRRAQKRGDLHTTPREGTMDANRIRPADALNIAEVESLRRLHDDPAMTAASTDAGFVRVKHADDGKGGMGHTETFQVFVKVCRYDEDLLAADPDSGGLLCESTMVRGPENDRRFVKPPMDDIDLIGGGAAPEVR